MKVDPRFMTGQGPEVFTGCELLIKGALEADGGTHLLTGYPGSPVAGFFDTMTLIKDLLNERGVRAVLANNEALSAAMVNGSQLAPTRAITCMKSVGVHVAADGLAQGNLSGPHPAGGVIVVYGDDPWSDSTQSPADSRYISRHLFIPVLEPATPQEVKDFIDLGFKLSNASGLYAGFVLTTNLADGGGTVQCRPNQFPRLNMLQRTVLDSSAIDPKKYVLLPPNSWRQEETLPERLGKAVEAARRLGINRIEYPAAKRRPLGFATSGLAHGYLLQTLAELGLLGEYPVLKFGMSYPVDSRLVEDLAGQCERIIVVEERRGFMEEQIGEAVLKARQAGSLTQPVEVWGKRFPAGLKGLPQTRGLHPSIMINLLVPLLKAVHAGGEPAAAKAPAETWEREIRTLGATADVDVAGLPVRAPTFCPGCPHRDSAGVCIEIKKFFMDPEYMRRRHGREPVDLVFHGDAGCYVMLMYPPSEALMRDYSGMGLGGGTGAGSDPFIKNKQVVFMGDGTFFHSGALAISQAVKIGQDITFIILDNRTTAMTGHQPTPGEEYDIVGNPTPAQDMEAIVRGIAGDQEVTIARVDPQKRSQYRDLLERTFLQDGVKVVIADKECGITRMRRQKRKERAAIRALGFLPAWRHMNINPDICRFCLACAEYTGCPGLKHAQTDYGPKMDTDITWCVDDGACERVRACSAFEQVVVKRKRPPRTRVPELGLDDIPEPQKRTYGQLWRCCLAGVGGMGIGLATSIIVRAGHNQGYSVYFVDKKGLAIRNGGVVSQVVYSTNGVQPFAPVIPYGKADLLVGMDVLEAARTLDPRGRMRVASPQTTAAVINTDKVNTITGLMGRTDFDVAELETIIRANTRGDDFLARDISRICEKYLGSKLYANIMMLGFAFQKGLIPVSMHSMAWAIKDTIHADFRKNLYAFNMGRKLVVQPELFQGPPRRTDWRDVLEEKCRYAIRRYRGGGGQKRADLLRVLASETVEKLAGVDEELKRAVVVRIYDCMRWGGIDYARRYAAAVARVRATDGVERDFAATRAVVFNLAGAMLVKDAVFVAELATSPEKYARDREKYNVNPANGDRIVYRHLLHPDVRIGKRRFTADIVAYDWMLKLLRSMRFLRKLLPASHRQQRQYLRRYEAIIDQFCAAEADRYDHFLELLSSARCVNCANPSCSESGCPLSSRIPEWVELVFADRWREAAELLLEANNFPEFTARVCPAPCEESCKRTLSGYPVGVRQIELQIIERALREGWIKPQPSMKKSGRRVAVVGSGPAGLAAAQQLARAGHDVVVYEKDARPGGLLRYGIPDYRLEKEILDRRLEQLSAEGVVFKCGVEVGKNASAAELKEQFDAVLLTVGAAVPRDLNVPGREAQGVYFAMDFLRREGGQSAVPSVKGKVVAVIGGGLTGQDCVESALREGARKVHQLEILPPEAVGNGHASSAGGSDVHRRYGVSTKSFGLDGQKVCELRGVQVKWSNSSAGRRMSEIQGTDFVLKVDVALLALGFDARVDAGLAGQLRLPADDQGRVRISDGKTTVPGVFAAGDVAGGPAYVAAAISGGRRAAKRIDEYLALDAGPGVC